MRRTVLVPTLLVTALAAVPCAASADTLFGGNIGVFVPRGLDGRTTGDVLAENITFRTFYATTISTRIPSTSCSRT
jgi:hypothetical protein